MENLMESVILVLVFAVACGLLGASIATFAQRRVRERAAQTLRGINEAHRTARKDDPHWQLACEAAYTGLDDVLAGVAEDLDPHFVHPDARKEL